MNKTRIDWCDHTWNPVWGCRNRCPYCYARKTAERFRESFEPHWKERSFQHPMPFRPSRIFVNSMSDIAFWEPEWMRRVLERIASYPHHAYLFLTKQPRVYDSIDFPQNCWMGVTVTCEKEIGPAQVHLQRFERHRFLSLEPLHGFIPTRLFDRKVIDWVIIGAETGNRVGRVLPRQEWTAAIVATGIPVFMKANLQPYWDGALLQLYPRELWRPVPLPEGDVRY